MASAGDDAAGGKAEPGVGTIWPVVGAIGTLAPAKLETVGITGLLTDAFEELPLATEVAGDPNPIPGGDVHPVVGGKPLGGELAGLVDPLPLVLPRVR